MVDLERLGLSAQDQERVDSVFLSASIDRVNSAGRDTLWPDTIDEIERINGRTFERAHDDIIAERPLDETTIQNLAKLSFLNTLELPTYDDLPKHAPDEAKAIRRNSYGKWLVQRRRLFTPRNHTK